MNPELQALRKLEAEVRDLRKAMTEVPVFNRQTRIDDMFAMGVEFEYCVQPDYVNALDDALALVDSVRSEQ